MGKKLKNQGGYDIMFYIGGVDVKNPNALISMAYVSQNANNPYAVFCEYIKYCIAINTSDTVSLADVRTSVGNEFGLHLPYNVALKCLKIISGQGMIIPEGRQFKRVGTFDEDNFNRVRLKHKETEAEIINALMYYVRCYGKDWTYDYARGQLIKILDKNGLAYDIFFHTKTQNCESIENIPEAEDVLQDEENIETEDIESQPLFSDDYYVGKFIQKTMKENTVQTEYLRQICEGLMLCVGAYQIPSEDAEIATLKINGTTFFFDTRLLLRLVGCGGEAATTATKELVQLIQNSNGVICYFPHTLEEMLIAFDKAIHALENGYAPRDDEMRIYASTIRNSISILQAKRANLKSELEKNHIYIRELGVYSDSDKLEYGFSLEDLQQHMCSALNWERQTILNDARSIWEVHMQRRGDYTEYCGTQSRLPVFVTNNSRLIGIALDYQHARPNTTKVRTWKSNRLPVITDMRLTCRLWSPITQGERLSMLYLAANTVAAQRPTQKYLNKIRECAIELGKRVPEYSDICLPAFFDDNVTDAIFESTQGSEDNLNIGLFATTIAELAEWKARDQEEVTKRVTNERDILNGQYNSQTEDIIEGAVQQCNRVFQKYNRLLWIIHKWPIVTAIVFTGASAIISQFTDNWTSMWSVLVVMVVALIEKITESHFVTKAVLEKVLPWVIDRLYKDADNFLRKVERPYKEKIIEKYCNRNKLFCECKGICKSRE